MRNFVTRLRDRLHHFVRAREGVAAVEFALIMPLLLLLYLGTVEASRLISYDRRITTVASALGDLVARHDAILSEAELVDYFTAAEAIISPLDATGLRQIVANVYVDADGHGTIVWSRDNDGNVPYAEDETYDLPEKFSVIASERNVIVSEASLTYLPITTYVFEPGLQLKREYYHLPRFGTSIYLN